VTAVLATDPADETAGDQVETLLFRALIVLRVVVLLYAVVLNIGRFDEFARPALAVVDLAVMAGWTAFVSWAYDDPRRRRLPLYLADLLVSVALMLTTPLVQSEAMLDRHASTMPSFWVMTPVLAWAVGRRWWEAVLAAVVVSVADLSVRTVYSGSTWGNIFLLLLAAGIVGYSSAVLRRAAELRAAAERAAAIAAERARLSRAVHDGVLQVLGLVQRQLGAAGGDLSELARLAGEQETRLRALVQDDARLRDRVSGLPAEQRPSRVKADPPRTDLMQALEGLATSRVTVSGPASAVMLEQRQVEETTAAVRACLDNVARHVGEQAPGWVLVEDLGSSVVVTVRDDGPGIAPGRLEEAAREGRLGVTGSIRGRIEDLGGVAVLTSAPGSGTEWELTVPRSPREDL
jgi:signal transduction histidine kinase